MTHDHRPADWPLRARLALLLVLASLLPLAIWAYVDLQRDRARMLSGAQELLQARADQIVRELDTFHRGHRGSVERLALFPDARAYCVLDAAQRALRQDAMRALLSTYPASDAGIRGAALLDGAGRIVIATETALEGVDLADRPVVRLALQGRSVISDPFTSSPRSGAVPTVAYMAPMLDADRKVIGVAVLWLRAQSLWQTVKASNALAGPGSFAVLFDRDGIRIAHTDNDEMIFRPGGPLEPATLERLVAERRFGAGTRALLEDVKAFPEQFERARAPAPDLSVFRGLAPASQAWSYGVARRFETVPWTVFYMLPEAGLDAEIAAATRERILIAAAVMAGAAIVGLLVAGSIVRPVQHLGDAARAITDGDLSARVPDLRGDELGHLGDTFNAMAARLQLQTAELQRSRDELEHRVRERTAELTETARRLLLEGAERARVESALHERDAALHRAHVMSRLAHVVTRPDGAFESWSETLPPLIGVAPADMPRTTREWLERLHEDDRERFRRTAIAAGSSGVRHEVQYRMRRADGDWVHIRQVIEPIPGYADIDGKMRWFSTLQDVTAQEHAAEELRASRQLLEAIVDNSAAVIYVKDLAGRYLLINRHFAEIFHTDREAVLGKTDHDLLPPQIADTVRDMDRRVAEAAAPLVEEEIVPVDGVPRTYVSVKCPLRDAQGRLCGVFGISTDITEGKRAESALRASEERNRLVVDTALDAVITMDSAGVITGWNPQAENSFGWSRAEAIGRPLADTIVPPRYREAHQAGLVRYLAGGEGNVLNTRIELSALHREGHEFPVDLSITPIGSGDSLAFSAFVRDITERKRTDEMRLRLAAIIESSDDSIVAKSLDGVILTWNRGAERLFGYRADEAVGQPMQMLMPAKQAGEEPRILSRIARGQSIDHFETVRVRKDGSTIDVSVTISPIQDAQGVVVGASTIARDITERKLAEQRQQAQLGRLNLLDQITRAIGERQDLQSIYQVVIRSLEERLPVDFSCICRYDAEDQTLTVIRVGVRSRALAMELAMGEQARIGIDPNGLSRCVRGELVYESDTRAVPFPFPQRLASGGLHSLVAAPLQSESQVFGILVAARAAPDSFSSGECEFLRQLSGHVALAARHAELHGALQRAYDDLRQSQQTVLQQERLRALGQMASGIAHDINNAISPVALYTESLLERETGLSERGRGYLTTIARAIDDVAATVARMREFYRPRELQLALASVQANALIGQVIDLTRARWSDMPQERGSVVKLQLDLAEQLPPLLGVESEVREALINLVLNAVDAMPDGGTLRLSTRAVEHAVELAVSDTGMGMDEDTRRRCLEPFFTTKGERGSGLGLAMVYGIAQRHGAELDIESARGQGTTVRLTFPVASGAPVAADVAPRGPTERLAILIVDDDPLLLESLRDALQLDGHAVTSANGGQAGIDAFAAGCLSSRPFDLVITDLGMPYVDGRQVAAEVKARSPGTPVVMLTGWGQRLAADEEMPAFVDKLLSKPPKLREVRAALVELRKDAP